MKRIVSIALALLCMAGISMAQNALTVPDTNVPQGGQGEMVVNFQFVAEDEIAAYQFELALPEGVSLVPNGKRYYYEKGDGYNTGHQVSINYAEGDGVYVVTCTSLSDSYVFSETSGMLIKLRLQADEALTKGTSLNASLKNVNLSTVRSTNIPLDDVSFRVVIGEASDIRTELFETSTTAPEAASNVNVRVYRTINANEWSTICLPFAMTEAQTKAAFGDDVQLGDFKGAESSFDNDDQVVGITVSFDNVTAIDANHPYIIKVSSPVTEFTVDRVDIVTDEDEAYIEFDNGKTGSRRVVYSGFYGTYHAGTVLDKFTLFLNDNKFWYSAGSTKMKAFRAYFEFLDVLTEVEDAYSSRISMNFDHSSGIGATLNDKDDNAVYDLQGRHITNPGKGVFVKDGKKLIIK